MIYLRLSGGLGNQLIQLAAAYKVALASKDLIIFLDATGLNNYKTKRNFELDFILPALSEIEFATKASLVLKIISRYRISKFIQFMSSRCSLISNDKKLLKYLNQEKYSKNIVMDGYFQDCNLFFERDNCNKIYNYLLKLYPNITQYKNKKTVGIHIRGGDYKDNSNKSIFYNIPNDYYVKSCSALEYDSILVFSDDIEMAKNIIKLENAIFVSDLKLQLYEEFILLMQCDSYIISNSTFSWCACNIGCLSYKQATLPKFWFANSKKYPLKLPFTNFIYR